MDNLDSFRIDPLTAEFLYPDTERRFREFIRHKRVRDTRLAILLAALFYLGFALTDFLALGVSREYIYVFLTRLVVCGLGLTAALFARRYWQALVSGLLPTLVVAGGMLGFLAITLLRPYEAGWHGMSMMAMLLGVYVFVPNRFLPAFMVAVISSLVFLPLMAAHFQLPLKSVANLTALLTVINILGAMTAYRVSRLTHEEFRDAAVLTEANEQLRREVEERQRLEANMRLRAERDDATGILNRNRFFELAEDRLRHAAEQRATLSLLLLDLDYFKQVNVTYGHHRGDEVLKALVSVCGHYLGDDVLFARLGGEEFVILLEGVTVAGAAGLAERIRDECRRTPVDAGEVSIFFTVSIGVAQWHSGEPINVLLRRADEAVSSAKYLGRNRVEQAR